MKTVYIHIGLGKTGTSFLQTAFAYNAERYLSRGLSYPDLNNDHSTAAAGGTTSGNGMPIAAHGLKQISHIKTVISPNELLDILDSDLDHLLSSEWLGGCQLSYLQDLQSTLSKKFYVQFVVVVRDPLEHVVAIYQEGLKSGTFSSSLEVQVEKILAGLKRNYSKIVSLKNSIKIINYDFCRKTILDRFDDVIFGERFSNYPPVSIVNPSPDAHQTAVLQIANGLKLSNMIDARKYILDSSVSNRPKYVASNEISDVVFEQLATEISEVNRLLPENEPLQRRNCERATGHFEGLDACDIDFLSLLIEKKLFARTVKDYNYIAKWARQPKFLHWFVLPRGFDVIAYLAYNPDLVEARVNPIKHYRKHGKREGRRYK